MLAVHSNGLPERDNPDMSPALSMENLLVNLAAHPLFAKGLTAGLSTLFILLMVRLAQTAAARKITDKDLRYRTRKVISLGGYLIVAIIVLTVFSEQMSNLAVIIGALSVGIGFAMRELIQSLIGWLAVSFLGLYKPGERIQMGSIMGDVIDISPLTTTVMECGGWVKADLYNGRLVHLSNSLIFRENIINYTSDFPFLWDEIVIPVRVNSDHRIARNIIETSAQSALNQISEASKTSWMEFARHYRVEDARLDPVVTMSFDANWIEFTLRYVVDARLRRSTKDRLYSSILLGIEATGGKVQVATATLQLTGLPPFSTQSVQAASNIRDHAQ